MHAAVKFVGVDDSGEPVFDVDFTYPEAKPGERSATSAQRLSVADFYTYLPPDLTFDQAHSLLSYRSFARAVADVGLIQFHERVVALFARLLACHISNDRELARAAIVWSEDCFENPDDPCPIERVPGFAVAVNALAGWMNQAADAGVQLQTFC